MAHRNARLTPRGRLLLVERVRSGMPVAHVAQAMGVSRQCAHRWVRRFDQEGRAGLEDRSSRPHPHADGDGPEAGRPGARGESRAPLWPRAARDADQGPRAHGHDASCAVTASRAYPSATR